MGRYFLSSFLQCVMLSAYFIGCAFFGESGLLKSGYEAVILLYFIVPIALTICWLRVSTGKADSNADSFAAAHEAAQMSDRMQGDSRLRGRVTAIVTFLLIGFLIDISNLQMITSYAGPYLLYDFEMYMLVSAYGILFILGERFLLKRRSRIV